MKKIFEEFKERFKYCSPIEKIAAIGGIMLLAGMSILCFRVFSLDLPLSVKFAMFLISEGVAFTLGCGLIDTIIM